MIKKGYLNFGQRIFISIFGLILFFTLSISFVTYKHFAKTTDEYHLNIIKSKESTITKSIQYLFDGLPYKVDNLNVGFILSERIFELRDINSIHINVFTLSGNLILTTEPFNIKSTLKNIEKHKVLANLEFKKTSTVNMQQENGVEHIEHYFHIYNNNFEPVAIINLPYYSDASFFNTEYFSLLKTLWIVMAIILLITLSAGWLLSFGLTKKLSSIAEKIKKVDVLNQNEFIEYNRNDEIKVLVDSYNVMLKKIQTQSQKLLQVEREETWQEVAKQIAHEIKNPLTPMSLMVQDFKRKFDPTDKNSKEKVNQLCNAIYGQINSLSSISESFAEFSKMPKRNDEKIELVNEIKTVLAIFEEKNVIFSSNKKSITFNIDRLYVSRVVTNLTKNAFQAIPKNKTPKILIHLEQSEKEVVLSVSDNGTGIDKEGEKKIFEPKFTTKSSGMGLGLAMVRKMVQDYNGKVYYKNNKESGCTFFVVLPIV